jgi:hypothetical protein
MRLRHVVIGGASLMGGRGTIFGACLGALFMASLDNGMLLKNIPDFTQDYCQRLDRGRRCRTRHVLAAQERIAHQGE